MAKLHFCVCTQSSLLPWPASTMAGLLLAAGVLTTGFPCCSRLDRLKRVSFDGGGERLMPTNCQPSLLGGNNGWT